MYAPGHNLADVTCPPYDTIAPATVADYEAAHPHNIVRLILPRSGTSTDRHAWAAAELERWLDEGVLATSDEPALYVYAHSAPYGTAVGLVGGIGIDGPILPHEGTFAGPVADRVALMSATRAQLEPILLTYQGNGTASDIVDGIIGTPPDIEVEVSNGSRHRLWRISDPELLLAINADLASKQALIADGHHRFAAYQQMHAEGRPGTDGFGLAVLVDAARHPLALRGMHRSVAPLSFETAVLRARAGFDVSELEDDPTGALESAAGSGPTFLIGDGRRWAILTSPDDTLLESSLPSGQSATWRALDAAILRHALLERLWDVDDMDEQVRFHSDPDNAIARAASGNGVAAIVRPPRIADVLSLAAQGERMPQKATSFGPKPLTGLLMRLVR